MASQQPTDLKADIEAIKKTIVTLIDAMHKRDLILLKSVYSEDLVLQRISTNKEGKSVLITEKDNDFERVIDTAHKAVYDGRVALYDIEVCGCLANVWAPYKFYINEKFSYAGVDIFQLTKTDDKWRIIHIVDTRCKPGKK